MLTPNSKRKLIILFQKLEEDESHAESLRQILCQQDEFEPYLAFKNIAQSGVIIANDIYQLLQKNGLAVQIDQITPIIKWYSQKSDTQLTYSDFMAIVLPVTNLELRKLVTQRPTYSKKISYQIEYALCRVLYKEVQIHLESLPLKQELRTEIDYRTVFQSIDKFESGIIQLDLLEHFLNKDASLLIRRLDQNRDQQIDLEDFRMALCIDANQSQSVIYNKIPIQQEEQENRFINRRALLSVKNHIERTMNQNQKQTITPNKKQQNFDLDYLAEALRIIADLENENEIRKEELGYLQYDLLELYTYFDSDQKGKLAPGDVKATLEDLQIYPTQSQLFLWMKRFDNDRDGKWSTREFIQAFKPMNYQKVNPRKLDSEILDAIKSLIKTEIENEVAIECIRQKLSKRANFDLKKLFCIITQKQVIVESELRCFLENHGVHLDDRLRVLLMKRFDKTEQNYITYSDFLNELYPKQGKS